MCVLCCRGRLALSNTRGAPSRAVVLLIGGLKQSLGVLRTLHCTSNQVSKLGL